jgi:hypothetical protein
MFNPVAAGAQAQREPSAQREEGGEEENLR